MIEIVKNIDPSRVQAWLEKEVAPHLTPDVSRYAKGRMRAWLGVEPSLKQKVTLTPGVPVADELIDRMRELVGFGFDYCLATYSGELGIGIAPHRDAKFADFEAYSWEISGEAQFDYWCGRNCFGRGPNEHEYNPLADEPTHSLVLNPGDVLHFNCKNIHAANPGKRRWNLNFWKIKE